jgi:formate/nitrite transporter FocA (FNT family)
MAARQRPKAQPTNAGSGQTVALSQHEEHEVRERATPRAAVIFETIRREGENELERPTLALAASGLAAGLSMGFSLVATGVIRALLPEEPWRPLLVNLGYTIGFLFVVMGRQQLFTENTLTVVLPLLDDPKKWPVVLKVARLWGIVLAANVGGAAIFAYVVAHTAIFPDDVKRAFDAIGTEAATPSFGILLLRGIFAGWLLALMVWLLPSTESARPWIIIIITYFVGLGAFSHVVAGSVEVLYTVAHGDRTWLDYLGAYALPTLIGNTLGGVSLVALLNYAQVVGEGPPTTE